MRHLTLATFAPHQGEAFQIIIDAERALTVTLIEATTLSGGGPAAVTDGRRATPFSLVFRGGSTPILPQRIYPVTHPVLGRHELFLVPIGPDQQGMRYEAIFT